MSLGTEERLKGIVPYLRCTIKMFERSSPEKRLGHLFDYLKKIIDILDGCKQDLCRLKGWNTMGELAEKYLGDLDEWRSWNKGRFEQIPIDARLRFLFDMTNGVTKVVAEAVSDIQALEGRVPGVADPVGPPPFKDFAPRIIIPVGAGFSNGKRYA